MGNVHDIGAGLVVSRPTLRQCRQVVVELVLEKQTSQAEGFLQAQLALCRGRALSKRALALRAMLADVWLHERRSMDAADLVEENLAAGGRIAVHDLSVYELVCSALVRARHLPRARRVLRLILGRELPRLAPLRDIVCTAAKAWMVIPREVVPVLEQYLQRMIKRLGIPGVPASGPLRDRITTACDAYRAGYDRWCAILLTPVPADPVKRREIFASYPRSEPVRFFRQEARRSLKRSFAKENRKARA